ncbi:MAG: dihydrodipicolinate synthase family protein [Fimbriimonadaceae bacterium]|nr:dihydrodipicolinate synthase family protein [Fimbriimonadaceae bacterium]
MTSRKLRGIFCPHMVPLDDRDRINEPELRRMVEWLIQRGVHGLYPNGSTGEFTRFSFEERKEIVRIVTEQAAGRVTIMAGAAEANVKTTLAACEYYHRIGCDTAALIPPMYFPVQQPNIREYFLTVARESPIDLTVYKIPQFTSDIHLDTLKRLAEHPRIIGIKDSSRDFPGYLTMMHEVRAIRPDFSFLIGCEEILCPSLLMGGDGGTIATSGVVPELIVEIYNRTVAGDLATALPLQYALLRLIRQLVFGVEFPEGVRVALGVRGFQMGASRVPLSPEVRVDAERVKAELTSILTGLRCELQAGDGPPAVCAGPAAGSPAGSFDEATVRALVEKVVRQLTADGR